MFSLKTNKETKMNVKRYVLMLAILIAMVSAAFAQNYLTNLPTGVDVVIQTTLAGSSSIMGYWDLPGNSGWSNGARIQLWDIGGNGVSERDRRFRFEYFEQGWYIITSNAHGVVDVPLGGVNSNGTQITLQEWHGRENQRFRFVPAAGGTVAIQTHAGKYLHVAGGSHSDNGTAVHTWDGHSATWRIYTMDGNNRRLWDPSSQTITDLQLSTTHESNISRSGTQIFRVHLNTDSYYSIRWDDSDRQHFGNLSNSADIEVGIRRQNSSSFLIPVTDSGNYTRDNTSYSNEHRVYSSESPRYTPGWYIIEVRARSGGNFRLQVH